MDELPKLSELSSAQKDELILQLFLEVQQLKARLLVLEARLLKNSHNSHKPPSSDGFGKTKKTNSLRRPSGKKPGGQAGHKGSTLECVSTPDEIIQSLLPEHCDACGTSLCISDAEIVERRQVFDIPVMNHHVVEYQSLKVSCSCGKQHTSKFAQAVSEAAQYGPNVRALALHLSQGQLLPVWRTSQLIGDLFQLNISPGTIMRWTDEASTCLMPVVSKIADGLVRAPVAHADESGLRVASSLCWLHTVASETLTWYGIHTKRGMDAIEAHGILPKRMAVLVHDCWGPYWNLPGDHALCNAHLLRELIFVRETTQQTWPTRMIDVLCNTNALCEAARAKGDTALSAKQIENIARQYEAALIEGEAENPEKVRAPGQRGRVKQSTAFNLLRRMREHANEVLRFSTDLTVPFTNNLAERAIRMPKAKQKISGCFRTVKGAENFCVIRSYLDTLRKQGLNIFQALCATFHGKPIQPATG